jgi:transposase-like protein/IS1 family transposase
MVRVKEVPMKVVFQKWRWIEMNVTLGLIFVASQRKEWPMTFIAVRCPHSQSDQIVKRGKTARGPQRYLCQNALCTKGRFLLDSCNRGCWPAVKQTIIDMSLNARGVRDTARSLHICPNTVLRALKKKAAVLESVHTAVLHTLEPAEVAWDLERAGEAEAERDEMWSFVGHKGNPRWLWHAIDQGTHVRRDTIIPQWFQASKATAASDGHAVHFRVTAIVFQLSRLKQIPIDHHTGKVWAYVFGRRQDEVFLRLKALLKPFGLIRY